MSSKKRKLTLKNSRSHKVPGHKNCSICLKPRAYRLKEKRKVELLEAFEDEMERYLDQCCCEESEEGS